MSWSSPPAEFAVCQVDTKHPPMFPVPLRCRCDIHILRDPLPQVRATALLAYVYQSDTGAKLQRCRRKRSKRRRSTRLRRTTWLRWLFFMRGTLRSGVKPMSFEGTPCTKAWGAMSLGSFVLMEILIVFPWWKRYDTLPQIISFRRQPMPKLPRLSSSCLLCSPAFGTSLCWHGP